MPQTLILIGYQLFPELDNHVFVFDDRFFQLVDRAFAVLQLFLVVLYLLDAVCQFSANYRIFAHFVNDFLLSFLLFH